ncbi:MAG: FAD-dependent oxidoreductase [Candidatus Aramenus sp.]|jgi:NADH dehydrogenase|nr:FAD-dependent oxidoreductase [Candidatus Aramenus sp.]
MKVVILGSGFAGISAYLKNPRAVVLDKEDYFTLTHKLVDVVERGDPSLALIPLPGKFLRARVRGVDFKRKKVITSEGEVEFDKLIISLGFEQDTSKVKARNVMKLENVEDALKIREALGKTKSVAVLGGGTLGVELSGALAKMGKKVFLIEAQRRLLPFMSQESSDFALSRLQAMGVEVMLNAKVDSVGEFVETSSGKVRADLVVLTAGMRGPSIIRELGLSNVNNRMLVDEYLRSVDFEDVFGAGDCMTVRNSFVPMSAQVAVQSGERAMLNALGEEEKFSYRQLAVILRVGDEYFGDFMGRFVKGNLARLVKDFGVYRAVKMVERASLI